MKTTKEQNARDYLKRFGLSISVSQRHKAKDPFAGTNEADKLCYLVTIKRKGGASITAPIFTGYNLDYLHNVLSDITLAMGVKDEYEAFAYGYREEGLEEKAMRQEFAAWSEIRAPFVSFFTEQEKLEMRSFL